jgi:hypothetical protein
MNKLQHYQQYKLRYEIAILFCFFFINGTLLATSVIMEGQRNYDVLPFQLWEPFSWEYASAISMLFLFPCLAILLKKIPFDWNAIKSSLLKYFIASIVFSILHVGIMVAIKELIYWLMGSSYDFGDFWFEMFYEYRKDIWSFCMFLFAIKSYGFILSRLHGEANLISEGEEAPVYTNIDRLLVKKLGREFIIKVEDVQWLESSGNYVNLHINERIYPLRATLGNLSEQLVEKGFCRIHRSHAIRLDAIESITPLSSGDSEVKLETGKVLNLSRRYKETFKSRLG